MDNSTIQNVSNRMKWLQNFSNGERKDTKKLTPQDLKDARAFCLMEIEGSFRKISYNTLKQCLKSQKLTIDLSHSSGDDWNYFIALRRRCHDLLRAQEGTLFKETQSDITKHLKDAYRNALWHSNLCANAYLELRRDIQAVIESRSTNPELDYKKIERILKKSTSIYTKIISQTPDTPVPALKLVTEDA